MTNHFKNTETNSLVVRSPFTIRSVLFDIILSCATLILGEIIAAVICILWTGSREEGFGYSIVFCVPVGTSLFYLIRRRFDFLITVVQLFVSTFFTFILPYGWVKALNFLPDYFSYKAAYIIPAIAPLTLAFTKHLMDKIILERFISA